MASELSFRKYAQCAAGSALEIAIPPEIYNAAPGDRISLSIQVSRRIDAETVIVERHTIELVVPGPDFDARGWRA